MMKHILMAPVGGVNESIFSAIREFPTASVILIAEQEHLGIAEKVKKDLARFQLPATIQAIEGPLWDEVFRIVHETVLQAPKEYEVIINVTSGKDFMRCAVTSAAFVNGLKAFGVTEKGGIVLFPVLKFSYYNLLSERKMRLLALLAKEDHVSSLDELGRSAKMSLSLVSYHINGNLKSDGLKQLGLVDTLEKNGRVQVHLTTMGNLLLKGYV
jgi:DNA-binding transcriptional ArsR family regulator